MLGKLLKLLIALVLIPFVVAEAWTLFDLTRAVPTRQWHEAWVISFVAGFVTWIVAFVLLPRTLWLYVFGHEFTHALASMIAGGKISSFQVSAKGGHVMTDRVNWWITLSPYFVPLYALLWIALWITVDFYYPLKAWQPLLYFGIGLFLAFHFTFTITMLHPQQTDLSAQGYLFSGVIISLINLLLVLFVLSILTHDLPAAGRIFLQRIGQSYIFTGHTIVHAIRWAIAAWTARGHS